MGCVYHHFKVPNRNSSTQAYTYPKMRKLSCVFRIDPQKNQLLLVQAFAKFAKSHPQYTLALIGPISVDEYYHNIMHAAKVLGISQKVIYQSYPPDDPKLLSAYKAADMFVLPSAAEPFGIVVLEAWAAGVPVIASRVGGIPGFTQDGIDILQFESANLDQLVTKMTLLATDEKMRQRLITAGSASVQNYDWQQIAAKTLSLYEEVLGY